MPGLRVVPSAKSTNDLVKDPSLPDFSAVITDNQESGRGRLDRKWSSSPGNGLAYSFVTPPIPVGFITSLPIVVGVALVRALRNAGAQSCGLKWPNDVLAPPGKLAGILCEICPANRVVVGLGLNIRSSSPSPDANAVALDQLIRINEEVVDRILTETSELVRGFCLQPTEARLSELLAGASRVMLTLGQTVEVVEHNRRPWRAQALAISPEGHLVVRELETGKQRKIASADIVHLRQTG